MAKILKAKHERLKDLSVDLNPATVQSLISKAKSRAETPKDVAKVAEKEKDDIQRVVAEVYEEYEWILKRNNSLDFDDLLIYGVQLFERQPHILQRCKHILVDELYVHASVRRISCRHWPLVRTLQSCSTASSSSSPWPPSVSASLVTQTSPFMNGEPQVGRLDISAQTIRTDCRLQKLKT